MILLFFKDITFTIPVSVNYSCYGLKHYFIMFIFKFYKQLVLKNWIMNLIDYYGKKTDPPTFLDFSY